MAGSPHSHNAQLPPPPPPPPLAVGPRNISPAPPPLRGPPSSSPPFPMPYMSLPPPQVPGPGPPRYPFPQPPRPMYRPPMALPPGAGSVPPRPPLRPLKPPGIPDISKGFVPTFDKPFTTVYVGKIASTVDDAFLRSILQLCGPIKSWKRAHDPTAGGPKGFGFCEFETAEGVLRALRLLNKYNLDNQELVLNVNKDTREYLERYVAGKENDKLLEEAAQEEDIESAPGVEVSRKKVEHGDNPKAFGIVSELDKKGDEDALARLKTLVEERVRCRPIYRPLTLDGRPASTRERSKDLDDMNGRNEDDHSSERLERMEPSSSDMGRRDRDHRERDDDRHDRMERMERPRHMMKGRKQQQHQHQHQHRDIERTFEEQEREWEAREREKERQRLHDRERERERERERRREVKEQEEESDNEGKKKRYRPEERRRRRQREREDDIADAIRETEEIAEGKRRKLELEMQVAEQERVEADESREDVKMEIDSENESPSANGEFDAVSSEAARNDAEAKPVLKKLGFGISGSGKRASLPAVFHQADEEEFAADRKLRPLVPIDYSAEEMQAVRLRRSPSSDGGDGKESRRKSRRDRDKERDEELRILADSIPKAKEELFSYEVNWAIYDKHKLHENMKPWISKKIKEFLGEEEASFVDFIVSESCKHVSAAEMLEKLRSILDEEAEMFVLKMWRMLIFEIRRVETGLTKAPSS